MTDPNCGTGEEKYNLSCSAVKEDEGQSMGSWCSYLYNVTINRGKSLGRQANY